MKKFKVGDVVRIGGTSYLGRIDAVFFSSKGEPMASVEIHNHYGGGKEYKQGFYCPKKEIFVSTIVVHFDSIKEV